VSAVIPPMIRRGNGHFIGVSSLGDELVSPQAPSYFASKAGFSNYLGGLRLALKSKGINVTNIRFGFVDTKMAKGEFRPFMMSVERAVDHVEYCIRKRARALFRASNRSQVGDEAERIKTHASGREDLCRQRPSSALNAVERMPTAFTRDCRRKIP